MLNWRHARATRAVRSLPPKRVEDARKRADGGGGLGRGVAVAARAASTTTTPTPNPSPQGGGEQTSRMRRYAPIHREPRMIMNEIAIGDLSEFADQDHRILAVGALEVGIFRRGKKLYAYENRCPH